MRESIGESANTTANATKPKTILETRIEDFNLLNERQFSLIEGIYRSLFKLTDCPDDSNNENPGMKSPTNFEIAFANQLNVLNESNKKLEKIRDILERTI